MRPPLGAQAYACALFSGMPAISLASPRWMALHRLSSESCWGAASQPLLLPQLAGAWRSAACRRDGCDDLRSRSFRASSLQSSGRKADGAQPPGPSAAGTGSSRRRRASLPSTAVSQMRAGSHRPPRADEPRIDQRRRRPRSPPPGLSDDARPEPEQETLKNQTHLKKPRRTCERLIKVREI